MTDMTRIRSTARVTALGALVTALALAGSGASATPQPTPSPSPSASAPPSGQPTAQSSAQPSTEPTAQPTTQPGTRPSPTPGSPSSAGVTARSAAQKRYPHELSKDPYIPRSISSLQVHQPTCPAPPMPAPTNADGKHGYTVPIRLKVTDGVILAGYAAGAYQLGQKVPFQMAVGGVTGWIVARVALPSLRLIVSPGDVHICDGADVHGLQVMSKEDLGPPPLVWTQPDGTEYVPLVGSLFMPLIANMVGARLIDFVAKSVSAAVTGVEPDGSLRLATKLVQTSKVRAHPDEADFRCNITVRGSFGSAPKVLRKAKVHPLPTGAEPPDPAFFTPAPPALPPTVFLPTRDLSGAVEGGTAIIGSNYFGVAIPNEGQGSRCGGQVNLPFYGADREGNENFSKHFPLGVFPVPPKSGWPIVPGLTDISLRVTVDQISLSKALPSGYGFE